MASRSKDLRWNSLVLCYLLLFAQFIELRKGEKMDAFIARTALLGFHNLLNAVLISNSFIEAYSPNIRSRGLLVQ